MKKSFSYLLLISACLSFSCASCSNFSFKSAKIYNAMSAKIYNVSFQNADDIDLQELDTYLENEYGDRYVTLKSNNTDLLNQIYDVTPHELSNLAKIYRFFSSSNCGFLEAKTFIYYQKNFYSIGTSFGGYGVTQFAHFYSQTANMLYFIYSFGSGIHRSHIGIFDFFEREIKEVDDIIYDDICFVYSSVTGIIDLYFATIGLSDKEPPTFDCFPDQLYRNNVLSLPIITIS